jgi:hypothetical protein
MKTKLLITLTAMALFLAPNVSFGAAPTLGATSGFALFTASGFVTNDGASYVTGNIGSFTQTPTGFPDPGTLVGESYNASSTISGSAAADILAAYDQMSGITDNFVLGTPLQTQTLVPGVYHTVGYAALDGDLTLDGLGNPDALFVIKVNGALTVGAAVTSHINLINKACLNNVYWQINGAVSLGTYSVFRGTIVSNGQIELMVYSSLLGRGLTTAGTILLHNNVVTIASACTQTGIANVSAGNTTAAVTIAPNPFNSYTNITLSETSKINNYKLVIYNVLGKEVMNATLSNQLTTLNTSDLHAGIYFYKVLDAGKTIQTGKLVNKQ